MTSPVSLTSVRRELAKSSFRRLEDGRSRFALDHLPELVREVEDVPLLRDAVHSLAIGGRLTRTLDSDMQIAELLRICAEGRRDQAEGRRASNRQAQISSSAMGRIPETWAWVTLADLVAMQNGFAFKSHLWLQSGIPIVRIQNLNNRAAPYNYAGVDTVAEKYRISTGDVLLSWSGTPGTSFGVFIWDRGDAALNQHIFKCDFFGPVHPRYFQIAVNQGIRKALHTARGGVGLKHLTKAQLDGMPVPLPPVEEQSRIVRALDEFEVDFRRIESLLRG